MWRQFEKLEKMFTEHGEQSVDHTFCVKVARSFSCSAARAGKPIVKSDRVQNWFHERQKMSSVKETPLSSHQKEITPPLDVFKDVDVHADPADRNSVNQTIQMPKGEKVHDISELEFEAKSSVDGAWYDVESFLTHRFVSSGETEVRVRYVGFGPEEDEWVKVKSCVRERSIPLENWECRSVKVGNIMLCLQERKDQTRYFDARILGVQRKMHDIRGCRKKFVWGDYAVGRNLVSASRSNGSTNRPYMATNMNMDIFFWKRRGQRPPDLYLSWLTKLYGVLYLIANFLSC